MRLNGLEAFDERYPEQLAYLDAIRLDGNEAISTISTPPVIVEYTSISM
jgi:hypothetical protein